MSEFCTLAQMLRFRAKSMPDRIGFGWISGPEKSESWTYSQLDRRTRGVARDLIRAKVRQGSSVLLIAEPGIHFVVGFFGALYAGMTVIPSYPPRPGQTQSRLRNIVENAEVAAALTDPSRKDPSRSDEALDSVLPPHVLRVPVGDSEPGEEEFQLDPPSDPRKVAFLQYTSGSTAHPKGVMITHEAVLANLRDIAIAFGHSHHSLGVNWLPPYHDMGLIGTILQPIYVGFPTYLMSPLSFIQRPANWLKWISKMKATTVGAPNFALDFLIQKIKPQDLVDIDLSCIEVFYCGAEPIRRKTLERFTSTFAAQGLNAESLLPCYGMAEASLMISCAKRGTGWKTFFAGSRELIGCGFAPQGTEIRIVDPYEFRICAPGEIGEIWVRGQAVAVGYYGRPRESEEAFGASIPTVADKRWLRTGDLGVLENGELYPAGRIKDIVIEDGKKYVAEDIEELALRAYGDACGTRVAAFAVLDEQSRERIGLAVEIPDRGENGSDELHCRVPKIQKELFAELGCSVFEIFWLKPRQLPRTSSGKIQRSASREAIRAGILKPLNHWKNTTQ